MTHISKTNSFFICRGDAGKDNEERNGLMGAVRLVSVIWKGMSIEDIKHLKSFGLCIDVSICVKGDWYGTLRGDKTSIEKYGSQADSILTLITF